MGIKSGRRRGKRLLSFLLSLCIAVGLTPIPAMAADPANYVVLGDSISTGYGLAEGERSFAVQLAEEHNFHMTVLAEDGATSEDLYEVVLNPLNEDTFLNADVITVTIGGNDMMDALYGYLAEQYNAVYAPDPAWTGDDVKYAIINTQNPNYSDLLNFVVSNISGFSSSGQAQVKAQEAVYNLSAALAQLKNLNPDATVIVANQYHPYAYAATEAVGIWALAAPTIVQAFQGGIDLLNMGLGAVAQNYGCAVADAYTAFSGAVQNPCNASFAGILDLDFHPNAYGHTLMAEAFEPYIGSMAEEQSIYLTNPYQERDLQNGSRNTKSKVCTLKLGFAVEDPDLSLSYETSDPEVATVEDGKITYQGVGECIITVRAAATDLCEETSLEIPVKVGSLGTPTFTPTVTSRTAKKAFVATSSTVRGVDGWEVQYSIRDDFWRATTMDFPDTGAELYRVTCTTVHSDRTYYIHVRGYQILDGEKVYSDWSPVKTIRTK